MRRSRKTISLKRFKNVHTTKEYLTESSTILLTESRIREKNIYYLHQRHAPADRIVARSHKNKNKQRKNKFLSNNHQIREK
jgi:hypothetical protein